MITPRPYLSYSQMTLFEMSPEKYVDKYFYGREFRPNRNMLFGKKMADGLEFDEATGDPALDMMMSELPKFELMDIAFEVTLPNGKKPITLLIKPDTYKADYSAFKEYKLSKRKWTQKMVDNSGQVTFYAVGFWLKTGHIPQDIEFDVVKTKYGDKNELMASGEIWRCPTKRSMIDILKMTIRIKKAWAGIEALCEEELLLKN